MGVTASSAKLRAKRLRKLPRKSINECNPGDIILLRGTSEFHYVSNIEISDDVKHNLHATTTGTHYTSTRIAIPPWSAICIVGTDQKIIFVSLEKGVETMTLREFIKQYTPTNTSTAMAVRSLNISDSSSLKAILAQLAWIISLVEEGRLTWSSILSNLHAVHSHAGDTAHSLHTADLAAFTKDWLAIAAPSILRTADSANELRRAFLMLDTDNSGDISYDELSSLLREMHGHAASEEEVATLLKLIDKDGDGRVSLTELQHAMNLSPVTEIPKSSNTQGSLGASLAWMLYKRAGLLREASESVPPRISPVSFWSRCASFTAGLQEPVELRLGVNLSLEAVLTVDASNKATAAIDAVTPA